MRGEGLGRSAAGAEEAEEQVLDVELGTVLGGVVVGPRASELIFALSVAVSKGLTVDDLAETFTVYPSLSGSITEAARRLIAEFQAATTSAIDGSASSGARSNRPEMAPSRMATIRSARRRMSPMRWLI